MQRPRGSALAALVAIVLVAIALRAAWPLADPPDGLSWSGGIYTDPSYNYLPARYALFDPAEPTVPLTARYLYPLLNVLVEGLGRLFGISRLSTTLFSVSLGVLALLVTTWSVRRTGAHRAAVLTLALGAVCAWPILFSRILMVENLVAPLLALAALAALGRRPRDHALAALLATCATLLGKYQALGAAGGILTFVLMRAPNRRTFVAVLGTGAVLTALWAATVFLPHRAAILDWVQHYTTAGLHGSWMLRSPWAAAEEVVRTLRDTYLLHSAPVVLAAGGAFVLWTLGNADARRRRLDAGTAVFAFWIAGGFLVNVAMDYAPPRYFIPLVYPLIAATACQLDELLRSPRVPAMRRIDAWGPLLFWCLFVTAGAIRALELWGLFVTNSLLFEHRLEAGPALEWLVVPVGTPRTNTIWGIGAGVVLFVGLFWTLRRHHGTGPRWLPALAGAAVVLSLVANVGQWTWWANHRSYRIHRIQQSLSEMLGEGAIVLGTHAPLLTEGSSARAVWYPLAPGESDEGLVSERGFTHVILPYPSEVTPADIDADFHGFADRARLVHVWNVDLSRVRELRLFRVDGVLPRRRHEYRPTDLELACEAARESDFEECLKRLAGHRQAGGRDTPESLQYEGVSHAQLGRRAFGEERLVRAAMLDPDAPDILQDLAMLAAGRGDRDSALEYRMRALRWQPEDAELAGTLHHALKNRRTPEPPADRRRRLSDHLRGELGPEYEKPLSPVADNELRRGAEIWREYCARCHGVDGRGPRFSARRLPIDPGDVTDPKRVALYSPRARLRILTEGSAGTPMFGWKGILTGPDRLAVAAHLETLLHAR